MSDRATTITHFIIEEQQRLGGTGAFTSLLNDVITACKMISSTVNRGALAGNLGTAGTENVQGETQKKLDVMSNDIFIKMNEVGGHHAAMASEEMEDIYPIPASFPRGRYLLLFDPLDGSSNIDVNIAVGTIFSILVCPDGIDEPCLEHFLQPGTKQICSGYAIYGSSTMMVLTTGHGVNGFTLDRSVGEFLLTHPDMKVPEDTNEFAINASRRRHWTAPVRRYVEECEKGTEDGTREKDFNMRWVASMVAEIHRLLCRGGVFLYPVDNNNIDKGGKLRLMYEANPMSFIVEQAGGKAITGPERIMDVTPTALHQRVGVIMGSKNEVERIERYYQEESND